MKAISPFLIAILVAGPSLAIDSLDVGTKGNYGRWDQIRESSRFLAVGRDSIWMWHVEPDANLCAGIGERGGSAAGAVVASTGEVGKIPLGDVLFDGDKGTAYDPDENRSLERTSAITIDLGATFRVNHIRFYPRLDREHQRRFLQEFSVYISAQEVGESSAVLSFFASSPNSAPVVDRRFSSRDVRFITIAPSSEREWEIAEVEVYGDGTVPVGEFLSKPLGPGQVDRVWGKVRYEGGEISRAPVVVQTRTGPDNEPEFYFRIVPESGTGLERVSKKGYFDSLKAEDRGPIRPNPAWSGWEVVTNSVMRSPGGEQQKWMQLRVRMATPGAVLKRLIFEYTRPPVARGLEAEISPDLVTPGEETRFTLSMEVHLNAAVGLRQGDSGFRQLQVLSAAQITAVEKVLVDDRETTFTIRRQEGEGFTVNLFRRIEQNGTFIQVVFRGRVFRDYTRFEVRALDRRVEEKGVVEAYQIAEEKDVDPGLEGRDLVVRFAGGEGRTSLLAGVKGVGIFTPNGDEVNDVFQLRYVLLKLIEPARVSMEIYDLRGRFLRRVYESEEINGEYLHTWDGKDEQGEQVPPGLYLYQIRVRADAEEEHLQGIMGVVY